MTRNPMRALASRTRAGSRRRIGRAPSPCCCQSRSAACTSRRSCRPSPRRLQRTLQARPCGRWPLHAAAAVAEAARMANTVPSRNSAGWCGHARASRNPAAGARRLGPSCRRPPWCHARAARAPRWSGSSSSSLVSVGGTSGRNFVSISSASTALANRPLARRGGAACRRRLACKGFAR